jgi:hypothetical protein
MTQSNPRIAIVFPADGQELAATRLENTRFAGVAQALASAGAQVISAPYCDAIAGEIEERLLKADLVLVWINPYEAGHDRSRLNATLRSIAAKGVKVSAHPDVIDKLGTKDVLYQTRHMAWGTDSKRYNSLAAMQTELPKLLIHGPRVLKQLRGQSGDGVWRVSLKDPAQPQLLAVRHAKRGCSEELMGFNDFLSVCSPYFANGGAMIDQPFQSRLQEGMIRCYVVGAQVAGFGEQLVNALYPAPAGQPESEAPEPGPRHYFPADRPDFQDLKRKLEGAWIAQMCESLAIKPDDLPALWDVDFIRGEKSSSGEDTYVLCEINASSVYPFPPSALAPLVNKALRSCSL